MPVCPVCGTGNPPGARFCNACGARLPETARATPQRAGERRIVTMLFSDVRGSTAIAEELDAEEWTDVMNAAYEQLIAPIYRYEGTVARLMGDSILAFFGAPTAHEDDPQRAVMAGLEILEGIGPLRERLARERGFDLNVRVGINTGPVVVGDVGSELRQEYSAMGDAVNVAARMEQTAEPGTVQITEETHRLVEGLFDVEPLGEIRVKGKRRPLSTYRVLARLDAPWTVRATSSRRVPLVGREPELSAVEAALEGLDGGRGSVLLISGDPGIGKSRLVEEAIARWARLGSEGDRGSDVWRCAPYDAMQPYAQYRRLIRERGGIRETDPPELARKKIAALMDDSPDGWQERSERIARALLAVELPDEPPLEGEAFQREAIEVVVRSTLARAGRRLIVFEDLHWCDHASLELVRGTVRLVTEAPIAMLVTFRPDRDAPSWAFRDWALRELEDHRVLLELDQLSSDQSSRLIDEILPVHGMPDDVRGRILAKTEGNPLFLHEVARALIDLGVARRDDDGWRLASDAANVAIPDSIQSLITVGLDRLSEGARTALQAAAVIGRSFDADLLCAVVGASDIGPELDELTERELILAEAGGPRRGYTFRHALTQDAAYGTLLVKRRRVLHRRVALALEAAGQGRLEEVAALLTRHFSEAGDDEATLKYAVVAGEAAARLYANEEAAAHDRVGLDAALRIGAEPALLRSLFERRGSALELLGRYDDAIANYEEMLAVARAASEERIQLAARTAIAVLYATHTPKFDPERGRRLAEENVVMAQRLGDRAAEARALWNIVVASVFGGGSPSRAVEAGEASVAIARELGYREQLAFTLNDVSRAHMAAGDFPTAAERIAEAGEIWEGLDNRPMLADNLALRGAMHALKGNYAAALADAEQAYGISESIGNAWGQSVALLRVYRVQTMRGELGLAIGSIERCGEFGERGGFALAAIATRSDLARVIAYLGDGDRALALADEALAIARERFEPGTPNALLGRADALMTLGRHEEAGAALDDVSLAMIPEPERTFQHAVSSVERSRSALALGDPHGAVAIARAHLDELRSSTVRVTMASALVALSTALVTLGRYDDAERELGRARELAERLGERTALWEALALSASLHARRGDLEEAAELRRRARDVVEAIAAGLPDQDLRGRFLAREDVRALTP